MTRSPDRTIRLEQGQISDSLAGGSHFHNVAQELIHIGIGAADLFPAVGEPQCPGLLQQIGELAARHLMEIEIGIGSFHATFKGRVVVAHAGPIVGQRPQRLWLKVGIERSVAGRFHDGSEIGLAGEAG